MRAPPVGALQITSAEMTLMFDVFWAAPHHPRLIYSWYGSISKPVLFHLKVMWDDEGAIV